MINDRDKVRSAFKVHPQAAQVWRRVGEILDQLPPVGEEATDAQEKELASLLGARKQEMMAFLSLALPREAYRELWEYDHPAALYGTPVAEDWWDKVDRDLHAEVTANPLIHAYPGLLHNIQARVRARLIVNLVALRAADCGAANEAAVEQPSVSDTLADEGSGEITARQMKILHLVRRFAPISDVGLAKELSLTKDVVNVDTRPLRKHGYLGQGRGADNTQGWFLTAKGIARTEPT